MSWVKDEQLFEKVNSVVINVLDVLYDVSQVLRLVLGPVNFVEAFKVANARPDVFVRSSQDAEDLLNLVLL